MRNQERSAQREEKLKSLYLQTRRAAFCLSLCCSQDHKQAYSVLKKTYIWAGKRIGKKNVEEADLLYKLFTSLPLKRKGIDLGVQELPTAFSQLDKKSRCAWALLRAGGLGITLTQKALDLNQQSLDEALRQADAVLTLQDAQNFGEAADELIERREIWNEISFGVSKRVKRSHVLLVLAGSLTALILGTVLVREGWMAVRIFRFPGSRQADVLADHYESELFYKKFKEQPSLAIPNISQVLSERLDTLPDTQKLRVAFRFYDRGALHKTREGDLNLETLYARLFYIGLDRGQTHSLLANAISHYYENYRQPFRPKEREADFVSRFRGIYEAALDLARGSGYTLTVQTHPEIFGDEKAFYSYLYSDIFIKDAQAIWPLLRSEMIIMNGKLEGKAELPENREAYEEAIFAFFNPEGQNGRLTTEGFIYTEEETTAFFAARERLGKLLYEENKKLCLLALPVNETSSDILEGSESSLFSATLTKQELLALAQKDERFFFLGIATPYATGYTDRLEQGLGDMISRDLWKRYDIYQIDTEYQLYSINYGAPLLLPQGFIDDLRGKIPCRDTQFEKSIQYIYLMRYAHPQQRTGYSLLRALYGTQGLQFTSEEYKRFSKMAAY